MSVCGSCGTDFAPGTCGRPRLFCLDCRPRKPALSSAPAATHTTSVACDNCGECLPSNGRRFCSSRCKSYWWFKANEADLDKRDARRERQRRHRIRLGATIGPQTLTCSECSVIFKGPTYKQYCSRQCREFARNRRRREATKPPPILLFASAYRFGAQASKQKTIKVRTIDNGRHGLAVHAECPNCEWFTMWGESARRFCRQCGTEAVFNEEEWDAVHAGLITA